MSRRIAVSSLNASTYDILNTIRANASAEYQDLVPEVTDYKEVRKVGEVLYGYPALANQFLSALVNRIALVRIKSAVFNNAYSKFKKGYLEFGETVEEVFVGIAKAREFNPEKAEAREFKRSIPDVKSAFHTMNWRVQYPVTIQQEDLRMAFTSMNGVQDLIAKIVNAVYVGAEYDEFLLFKYLLIKAISHGKIKPVAVDTADIKNSAVKFRGISNTLPFLKTEYNEAGVHTSTPKEDQYIFMDATYNAQYDVEVLASAFNMDKADFMGKLELIDDWTTFDNERFDVIRENSDMIEDITAEELALMKDVIGVLIDGEWFQVYDNNNKFTEKYIASGDYWNYFYHVWKTVSHSPFSNAVVFVKSTADIALPENITVEVLDKSMSEEAIVLTLYADDDNASLKPTDVKFVQTAEATEAGIAIHPYGAIIFPSGAGSINLVAELDGVTYTSTTAVTGALTAGATITLAKG